MAKAGISEMAKIQVYGLLLKWREERNIAKPEKVWADVEYHTKFTVSENICLSELLMVAI